MAIPWAWDCTSGSMAISTFIIRTSAAAETTFGPLRLRELLDAVSNVAPVIHLLLFIDLLKSFDGSDVARKLLIEGHGASSE
jgi:hypothetical protein